MLNIEWARTARLNDLYYSACQEYTMHVQTGVPAFKANYETLFNIYKERGGKKEKVRLL